MRNITQSSKLSGVRYDVRGPILQEAERLERAGSQILKLNIGNPAPFGFEAPPEILEALRAGLPDAQGYSDSRGILPAREAVAQHYTDLGVQAVSPDDVLIGNGVSELISLVLQALVSPGDEILVPSPDYPLWTAQVTLQGGNAVHYPCDEQNGWMPDLAAIESLITDRSKGIVLINPNNPTGAVYSAELVRGFAALAEKHGLVLMADEIYDHILYGEASHEHAALHATETLCLTFSGLSKVQRVAGYRSGWLLASGNREMAADFLEGLTLLANMRMCANVPGQYAIPVALSPASNWSGIAELCAPGGRLREQRDIAHRLLTEIPGVSCVLPGGAMYLFPKLDPARYPIEDDQQFVIDLLRATHVMVTNGRGFNLPTPDHLRFVSLPTVPVLSEAIGRIAEYLESVRVD
ncbi:pyridoxal phosphate-dependent aminotransferase [Leucobacter sp. UT-8R-CII-1-4]|uniref:pyridoxal phosphate-dependent aminotransferase n=1 Tax=Leucobacter sp. UT-8R-CII-1-4 TaxID=3040075 RepID=UPI0024A93F53|nr:pyridoxal phosphate-dependent aminotransferase [Leucobacter sp. UT-8R-CII-1-4]MDI6023617.1 pyridoxal phosphate-dependent aminotransferase [Leucobacter sp. UT-8R-CII-1-4]